MIQLSGEYYRHFFLWVPFMSYHRLSRVFYASRLRNYYSRVSRDRLKESVLHKICLWATVYRRLVFVRHLETWSEEQVLHSSFRSKCCRIYWRGSLVNALLSTYIHFFSLFRCVSLFYCYLITSNCNCWNNAL